MTITELEKLAKAALNETAPYVRAEAQQNFRFVTNPETIIQLIELLREMGDALENLEQVKGRHHTEQAYNKCMDALQRYREMTK
jgi:hypothetical protein